MAAIKCCAELEYLEFDVLNGIVGHAERASK